MDAARTWWTERSPRWGRADWALLGAAALVVLLRWGDRARYLMSWDADTFAIALDDYNVRGLHPHAPGYPLFVALGRLAHVVFRDANDAYIAVGLGFTLLAVVLLYRLAGRLANRAVGLAAVVLLLAAPLVYVHDATANVYTADLACSLAVAWAAWECRQDPSRRRVAVLAATLALAVGVRPSILLFFVPVVAWAALRPPWTLREQARRLGPGAALGAGLALAWFLPMAFASGGIASWQQANKLQSDQVVFGSTVFNAGWPVVQANLARLALFFHWELLWAVPVLVGLVGLVGLRLLRRPAAGGPAAPDTPRGAWWFLAAWIVPTLLFYALVFDGWNEGPSGYALTVWPALALAGLLAARRALAPVARSAPAAAAVLAVLALAVPAVGLASHAHDVADVQYKDHDTWSEAWSHLPESFPPTNSTIVASYQFAHVWYNFPAYTTYDYRPPAQGPGEVPDFLLVQEAKGRKATPDWYDEVAARKTAGPHTLPEGTKHLVLFDFQLAGENGGPRQVKADVPVREAFLPNGWRVLVVDTVPGRPLLEDYFTLDGKA